MKLSIWWQTYGNTTVVLPYSLSLSPNLSVWLILPGQRILHYTIAAGSVLYVKLVKKLMFTSYSRSALNY